MSLEDMTRWKTSPNIPISFSPRANLIHWELVVLTIISIWTFHTITLQGLPTKWTLENRTKKTLLISNSSGTKNSRWFHHGHSIIPLLPVTSLSNPTVRWNSRDAMMTRVSSILIIPIPMLTQTHFNLTGMQFLTLRDLLQANSSLRKFTSILS